MRPIRIGQHRFINFPHSKNIYRLSWEANKAEIFFKFNIFT